MKEIKISVISPCFRMEKYLDYFLQNITEQTLFPNFEVVLDHNEPTEEEIQKVREFQQKYPGVIKHLITNPVEPIGVSMNNCIKAATSDYIALWNIDDLRTPNSLEIQLEVLEKGFGVANGNYVIVDAIGKTEGRFVNHYPYHLDGSEYKRGMIMGPFFAFNRCVLDVAGYFDEQLKSGADFDFCVRLAHHTEIGFVTNSHLGYYLDEGMGASTRPNSKQPVEKTLIYQRYGVLDKIVSENCSSYLEAAKEYDVNNIVNWGNKININTIIRKHESYSTSTL